MTRLEELKKQAEKARGNKITVADADNGIFTNHINSLKAKKQEDEKRHAAIQQAEKIAKASAITSIVAGTSGQNYTSPVNAALLSMPEMQNLNDRKANEYSDGTGTLDKIGNFAKRVDNGLWGVTQSVGARVRLAEEVFKQKAEVGKMLEPWNEKLREYNAQLYKLKEKYKSDKVALEADPEYQEALRAYNSYKRVIDTVHAQKPLDISTDAFKQFENTQSFKAKATDGLSDTGKFFANAAMSVAETGMAMPTMVINPAMPMALMGAGAGTDKMYEVAQSGGSASEALGRGLTSGVIEGVTEKLPLDNAMDIIKKLNVKNNAINTVKNIARQSAIEGAEEGVSYIANHGADKLFGDENAEFSWGELRDNVLTGAISGGVMGGGATALNGMANNTQSETKLSEQIRLQQAQVEEQKVDTNSLIVKLKDSIPELSTMNPVVELTGNEFPKSNRKLTEQVGDFFKSLGNRVTRNGFGDITIDEAGIQSSIAHGLGRAKAVTFASVPDIIKNGKEIDIQQNWKGRRYDTHVFAAPVKVGDNTGYVAAVVTKNKRDNRYYLHEVLSEEGRILHINKNGSEGSFKTGVTNNGITSEPTSPFDTSINTSIPQSTQNINNYSSGNENITNEPFGRNTVGSAEYNPNSLHSLADKYGYIPEGEGPKERIAIVPQSIDDSGKKIQRHARTAIEAKGISEEVVGEIESDILNGRFSYTPVTNKEANDKALTKIKEQGFAETLNYWNIAMKNGRIPTGQDIAIGERLLVEASQAGDVKLASQLVSDLSIAGTKAGQTVQAMRLLKKLTPEGNLYHLTRVTENLNAELLAKYKSQWKDIAIDESLAGDLLKAKNQNEINSAVEAIEFNIAEQIPANWVDKWNAWRYTSMLANPRTHVRNIVGNLVFQPAIGIKNMIGAEIESIYAKTNGLENRTKAVLTSSDKNLIAFGKNDYKTTMKDLITGTGKLNTQSSIEAKRRIFDIRALEGLRKTNFNALEAEDNLFLQLTYSRSLAQYVKANNYSIDFLNSKEGNKALEKARTYAANEALRATYRDDNKIVTALNNFRATNGVTKLAMDAIMPFRKTPANILARGIDYSPVGLVKGVKQLTVDVKNGTKTANEAIDTLSAGLTGTGIVALGFFLVGRGLLRGRKEEGREGRMQDAIGYQEYAMQIGNTSYTIDWAAPISMPLFVGCELYNLVEKEGSMSPWDVIDALTKLSDPMFNLSMLSGLNNIIRSAKYGDNEVADIVKSLPGTYLGQGVPTALGQVARTIDDTRRTTYSDKNKNTPLSVQRFIQSNQAKIPFINQNLEPYLDVWGREQVTENPVERALQNFASPGYVSKVNETAVDKEILRLYENTKERAVIPNKPSSYFSVGGKTYNLSASEYTALVKAANQKSFSDIEELIQTNSYIKLSEADKAEFIKDIYAYNTDIAKKEINNGYSLSSTYEKISKTSKELGLSTVDCLMLNNMFNQVSSDKNSEGNSILPGSKAEQNGEGKSASLKKKEIIDSIPNLSRAQREVLYELNEVSEKAY